MRSNRSMALLPGGRFRLTLVGQLALLASLVGALLATGARWAVAAPNPFEAHTSDEVRRLAMRGIPLDKLTPAARERVEEILTNTSVFRRMPVRIVDCDPEMYLFLLRHPDVVVNIWRVLGVTQLEARQVAPGRFSIADHAGTSGTLEVLYQAHDTHIVVADGRYEGPLSMRTTKGKCLLVFKSGYVRENDGRQYITTRLDSFLSLDPGAAELAAKVLQPVVGKVADNNFTQSITFLGSFSRTAEVNPQGVLRLARKLQEVPVTSREVLAAISQRLGTEYASAQAARSNEGDSSEETAPLPPPTRAAARSPQIADRPHTTQE